MAPRLRSIALLLLAAVGALVLGACGSEDATSAQGSEASASTDAAQVLRDTFTGDKQVTSARVKLSVRLEPTRGSEKPIEIAVGGPFQVQGDGKLPRLDMSLRATGSGQTVEGGVVSTGDKGYVRYQGTAYVASDQAFRQFAAAYEEAQKQAGADQQPQSLGALGIDPGRWLTNPRNAGETTVGDADVVKITGGVDVGRLLDDVDAALAKAGQLGLQGAGQLPQKLTAEQRRQVESAVGESSVEVYSGKADKLLRRLVVNTSVQGEGTEPGARVKLDFTLTEVNEDQEISAPEDAKPLDQLLSRLGGLGGLGALGGAGGGSGGGDAAQRARLREYTDCVTKAGSDAAEARKCAARLTP